jgi:hypothetical protein
MAATVAPPNGSRVAKTKIAVKARESACPAKARMQ